MTPEEAGIARLGACKHEHGPCPSCAREAITIAVEEESTKWMLATAHDHTCDFVRTPSPLCNCGANARLAELQVEGAAAIRARGSNATSD